MTAFAFPITVGHTTSPTVNVFEPTVGAFGKMGSAPPEHAATGVDMKNPGPQARSLKPFLTALGASRIPLATPTLLSETYTVG